jgi:TatD DNase family protein
MLLSQNGQRIVAALPKERVVTETDGPYSKLGGRPSEPKDIPAVVAGLARVWGEDVEQAHERVFENMSAIAAAARGARSLSSRMRHRGGEFSVRPPRWPAC